MNVETRLHMYVYVYSENMNGGKVKSGETHETTFYNNFEQSVIV